MPERIKDLPTFLDEVSKLLRLIDQSREVLFRRGFRSRLPTAIEDAITRLRKLRQNSRIMAPEKHREMVAAGLSGGQLALKLESFEAALATFKEEGGEDLLADALDKAGTILSSIGGAIPVVGSFAQELIDFILKELRRRWRFWRR